MVMMPRRLLALLLAARAITTATASLTFLCNDQCTCIGDDCGYASTGETVEFVEPTSPNAVPCRDDSDCEDASPREGPYYEACWTVADDPPFPSNELRVSYCAEERPRRRLRFSNYVDDRCFFVEGGDFYTDGITLAAVGAEEADEVFACAAARLAGVPQSRVVLLEIEQGFPQVNANFVIAVRGEAEARAVQTRLKYGDGTPPPVPLPPFDVPPVPLPPTGRRLNTGSEGNERATEAIKACAETRSTAPLAWRDASVNPFVAPPRVVQERAIPADVRGCCCGATGAPDDEPIIPVPVPLPFAFEEPPAPTPVPTITTTTETSRPYAESTTTTTRDE